MTDKIIVTQFDFENGNAREKLDKYYSQEFASNSPDNDQ